MPPNSALGLNELPAMKTPRDYIRPSKDGFGLDPFGYGALAWHKWGMAQTMVGFPVDLRKVKNRTKNRDRFIFLLSIDRFWPKAAGDPCFFNSVAEYRAG